MAAAAMRWGDPVVDTAICDVDAQGPRYRGHPVSELIGRSFEEVTALLWGAESLPVYPSLPAIADSSLTGLRRAVLDAERADDTRDVRGDSAAMRHGVAILSVMAAALGATPGTAIARQVANALAGQPVDDDIARCVETTLIVCAEHELNASTFAARVAASTGANLYACVGAALATFSGARHGGAARLVRRTLRDAAVDGARTTLLERIAGSENVAGFGQRLYPEGDPRFSLLWQAASAVRVDALRPLQELAEAASELGMPSPNLDFGLAAVIVACQLDPAHASVIFALGRTAGWLAHAREQREQGFMLRPRARYVGEN